MAASLRAFNSDELMFYTFNHPNRFSRTNNLRHKRRFLVHILDSVEELRGRTFAMVKFMTFYAHYCWTGSG